MRIETRLNDDEPAAVALRGLCPRDRGNALRVLVRKHYLELAGLVGLVPPASNLGAPAPVAEPKTTNTQPESEATETEPRLRSDVRRVIEQAKGWNKLPAILLAGFALSFAQPSKADARTLSVDVNLASVHSERWARQGLNQNNPGIGLTYQVDETWAIAVGSYYNSYRRWTAYALGEWTPLHIGPQHRGWHVAAGIAAGMATGYRRNEVPTAPFAGAAQIRITAPDGIGANLYVVPNYGARASGFVGLQISIPLGYAHG